jgi:hypothetical protein
MLQGTAVSDETIKDMGPNKLRRFWESARIELAEFDAPPVSYPTTRKEPADAPPQAEAPTAPEAEAPPIDDAPDPVAPGLSVKDLGGSWFEVTIDGESEKVRGRKALEDLVGTQEEVDELLAAGQEPSE